MSENPELNETTQEPAPPATEADNLSQNEAEQLKAQLTAQQSEMDELAKAVLAGIPDGLKALIPDELSPAQQVRWYQKAQAAGLLRRPTVPETDTTKPGVMPQKINPDELPAIARISYGYGGNA